MAMARSSACVWLSRSFSTNELKFFILQRKKYKVPHFFHSLHICTAFGVNLRDFMTIGSQNKMKKLRFSEEWRTKVTMRLSKRKI